MSFSGTGTELDGLYILTPGADPGIIRSRLSTTSPPSVDAAGNLHVSAQRQLVAKRPSAWQKVGDIPVPIFAGYVVSTDGTTGFTLGPYDKNQPLLIGTTLLHSTYLGGSGRDDAFPVAANSPGNAYIAGCTGSPDYPLTQALQPGYGGDSDVFISKINSAGTALVYSTYLGGSGYDEAWVSWSIHRSTCT